ncbi:MAG: 2-aminoethylphosphonate--pyruvate transaminase [Candidatus Poribacteria bacterium]
MQSKKTIMSSADKILFTPGPLTTSQTVKLAMLRDLGSRDTEFINIVKQIRKSLLKLAGDENGEYEAIIMQGSGTFSVEAIISSVTPPNGKWLVINNGAYCQRIIKIAETLKIPVVSLDYPENNQPNLNDIDSILSDDKSITHVAGVHCETTSGIINPIKEMGSIVKKHNKRFFVDAMSSFGAVPINLSEFGIDYIVSSANKCIEGVPGFAFVLIKRDALMEIEGYARSLSLDLLDQWKELEASGQFRFTPPIQVLLAFNQALIELENEGGILARAERYKKNHDLLVKGMRELGFKEYVKPEYQSYIITSFLYLDHPNFDFFRFYDILSQRGYIVYSGKVAGVDCFRIGHIGRIFESDVKNLLSAIKETLIEMGVIED